MAFEPAVGGRSEIAKERAAPSVSDVRPMSTRSYTRSDTNRNLKQQEAPELEHVRQLTKPSHSEQHQFAPATPPVTRSRSRDPPTQGLRY
ncbi:hypothetical protein CTI12_AA241270 [Artemisia annua]|uniref:Uncharacterized protein n=1 Tax=Artemisia annua TaxID=35608 RepID=A0A2U1NQ57_ARTAN|nr:hypothetical protein CTI12_AA241270 [Artemisia annua]